MATLITNQTTNVREDLGDSINRISPEKTPFKTEIGTTKATATNHQFLKDSLTAPNKNNAAIEGAPFGTSTLVAPDRISNQTQIFTGNVVVSATLQAVETAGSANEFGRQMSKVGAEMNRDIEAALVSSNASVAGSGATAGKLGGAEAWVKTNALSGTGGSTAGYTGGQVGAVVAGTVRPLTEALLNQMFAAIWDQGGDPSMVLASGALKQKISGFTGNATRYQEAVTKTTYAGVDFYVSDFGKHNIIPHHWMSATTVFAFDPSLWSVATLRSMKKIDGAKTIDGDVKFLVTELTLECKNEAGNGKIADVN